MYVYRNGITDDWKNKFAAEVQNTFNQQFSDIIDNWGYGEKLRMIQKTRHINVLDPEQAAQLECIRQSLPPDKRSIAFFCPTKSFRKQFGEAPRLLRESGHPVLHLFSEQCNDAFEQAPGAFRVWGDMVNQMDFIDVFVVPTIMNCLPPRSKKVLFYHISFAETELSTLAQSDAQVTGSQGYEHLVEKYRHLHAFFPLFDYIVASSPNVKHTFEEILNFYGRGHSHRPPAAAEDARGLLKGLAGQRLAERQVIIPAGYPPIDTYIRQVKTSPSADRVITYAPTPLIGKDEWIPFASAALHGPVIVDALARAFPDYEVVFKPYLNEHPSIIQAVEAAGKPHRNFSVDLSGGSHMQLYGRTALLISDFSSTAYTFGLSTLRPVLFFSHNEDALPESVRQSPYCQFRNKLGGLATTIPNLIKQADQLLSHPVRPETIRQLRNDVLYHPGHSDEYFAEQICGILEDMDLPDWDSFSGGLIEEFPNHPENPEPAELLRQFSLRCPGLGEALSKSFPSKHELATFSSGLARCGKLLGWYHLISVLQIGAQNVNDQLKGKLSAKWFHPQATIDISELFRLLKFLPLPEGIANDLARIWKTNPEKATEWNYLLQWIPECYWSAVGGLFIKPLLATHGCYVRDHAQSGLASVGFFCPTTAFRSHFGDLPERLEKAGYAVLHLYGETSDDSFEQHSGSFCVGSGGIGPKQLDFVDVLITPVVMDCLPERPRKVLVDHLSYAIFNPNKTHVGHGDMPPSAVDASLEEIVQKHTHASALFRLYDYHVAPSLRVMETLRERARFFGLSNGTTPKCNTKKHPDAKRLEKSLKGRRLTELQCFIPGGYPKLDLNIQSAEFNGEPKKHIVYAPTPFKTGENPEGWEKFMSMDYASEILLSLAHHFPDFEIIFKPYADEAPDLIHAIMDNCLGSPNIKLDDCGSHYRELYARTALMVSDISSTAYTFAFSTCRPVLFYSPNEAKLIEYVNHLGTDSYVEGRKHVGTVVTTPEELVAAAKKCLFSLPAWREKIEQFRETELYQVGQCTEYLTRNFNKIVSGQKLPEGEYYSENHERGQQIR